MDVDVHTLGISVRRVVIGMSVLLLLELSYPRIIKEKPETLILLDHGRMEYWGALHILELG